MVAGGMDDLSVFRDKLISLVDLLPDESAKLMDQRPRFAHAVLVLANQDLPGEILKANYIKQLDPYWIQTKGTPLSSPSQPIQLFNQQSLHLQTSNQDTQTAPFQWSSNLEDKMAGPGQKMTSSETSGVCSGGEDISQSPPLLQSIEVPIELKPASYPPVSSKPQEVQIRNVAVVREEEQESGGGLLGRAVNRTQAAAARSPRTKVIEIRRDVVADLRPLEQVYTETHIKSSYLRSQVEQTPFPSQDRQKITRYHSDAEDHLPQYKPLSRQSRYPPTKHDDPIIREAIRILEASCQLLDETAIRIAAVNNENQIRPSRDAKDNRSFRFPSEIRRNHGSRSNAESPNQPFAQSTSTTTTKLIKETLTTTNY